MATDQPKPLRGALAELSALVDRLGRTPAQQGAGLQGVRSLAETPPRPLKAMASHNATWSRLRVEQRLRQALSQVPADAGPLNSSHMVNRALQTLRDLSPQYLDAFMSHVDTLLWLEQASGAGDLVPRAAAAGDTKRRPAARGARKP